MKHSAILIIFLENQHVLHTVQKHTVYLKNRFQIQGLYEQFIPTSVQEDGSARGNCSIGGPILDIAGLLALLVSIQHHQTL